MGKPRSKESDYIDRQQAAADAKKAMLEKFRAKAADPVAVELAKTRAAEAVARSAARKARETEKAERKIREAEAAAAAEREAAARAAAEAERVAAKAPNANAPRRRKPKPTATPAMPRARRKRKRASAEQAPPAADRAKCLRCRYARSPARSRSYGGSVSRHWPS